MAYIDQDEDDRFRPLLGQPGAPAALGGGTPAPGGGAPVRPGQPRQQQSGFLNLQNWLGLNKGASENLTGTLAGRMTKEADEISSGLQGVRDAYSQPVNTLTEKASNERGHVANEGWAAPGDKASNYEYKGPTSLGASQDWRNLQNRLGTATNQYNNMGQNLDARQAWLTKNNMSGSRFTAAAMGNDSLLKAHQALSGTIETSKKHEQGFGEDLNRMRQTADPVASWFRNTWRDGDPNNWLENHNKDVQTKYKAKKAGF